MAATPGLHTLGKTRRVRNLHTSRWYRVSMYARSRARPWGLQQNDWHMAAMPGVDWRFLRQGTKEHVAAMRRDTW
eukprot:5202746-Lingulodinium_polyedra.AAC.1